MNTEDQNLNEQNYWKKCSTCKKEIPFSSKYYLCSVSTCQHKRKGYRFCSVDCWDAHLGFANHREAWAVEAFSPNKTQYQSNEQDNGDPGTRPPVRKIVGETPSTSSTSSSANVSGLNLDTLVVVSKVKKFIQEQSSFNTSKCGIDALTRKVAEECLKGIENAKASGRKTVMGRDIK